MSDSTDQLQNESEIIKEKNNVKNQEEQANLASGGLFEEIRKGVNLKKVNPIDAQKKKQEQEEFLKKQENDNAIAQAMRARRKALREDEDEVGQQTTNVKIPAAPIAHSEESKKEESNKQESKKVEQANKAEAQAKLARSQQSAPGDLLAQIREGVQLRKVSPNQKKTVEDNNLKNALMNRIKVSQSTQPEVEDNHEFDDVETSTPVVAQTLKSSSPAKKEELVKPAAKVQNQIPADLESNLSSAAKVVAQPNQPQQYQEPRLILDNPSKIARAQVKTQPHPGSKLSSVAKVVAQPNQAQQYQEPRLILDNPSKIEKAQVKTQPKPAAKPVAPQSPSLGKKVAEAHKNLAGKVHVYKDGVNTADTYGTNHQPSVPTSPVLAKKKPVAEIVVEKSKDINPLPDFNPVVVTQPALKPAPIAQAKPALKPAPVVAVKPTPVVKSQQSDRELAMQLYKEANLENAAKRKQIEDDHTLAAKLQIEEEVKDNLDQVYAGKSLHAPTLHKLGAEIQQRALDNLKKAPRVQPQDNASRKLNDFYARGFMYGYECHSLQLRIVMAANGRLIGMIQEEVHYTMQVKVVETKDSLHVSINTSASVSRMAYQQYNGAASAKYSMFASSSAFAASGRKQASVADDEHEVTNSRKLK